MSIRIIPDRKKFGPFWLERHDNDCTCSYCRDHPNDTPYSCGLKLPECKEWNSWRHIYFIGKEQKWYLRWTGFWMSQGGK